MRLTPSEPTKIFLVQKGIFNIYFTLTRQNVGLYHLHRPLKIKMSIAVVKMLLCCDTDQIIPMRAASM
jgi:hypothetical protein